MNSGGDCEKSLPGMGIPRWMKKTSDRYTYADICASPPTNQDGFLHINRHRVMSPNTSDVNVPGYPNQAMIDSPEMIPHHQLEFRKTPVVPASSLPANSDGTHALFKPVATDMTPLPSSTLAALAVASQQVNIPTGVGKLTSKFTVSSKPTVATFQNKAALNTIIPVVEDKILVANSFPMSKSMSMSRIAEGTEMSQQHLIVPKVTGGLTFRDQSEDGTPSATPTQTPTCSPQVARRTGNPFFTGTVDKTNGASGSWLFRSSSPNNDKVDEFRNSYEARGTVSATTSPQKVRLVPRPSELRELNFWSPTSM